MMTRETGLIKLDDMRTEEIARAIEARKPWRNLPSHIFLVARYGAFTLFIFQWFLYVKIDILWNIAISSFVLLVELMTNRYAIKTYSNSEIVGYLMKRIAVHGSPITIGKKMCIGASIAALGLMLELIDVPNFLTYPLVFVGLVWILFFLKTLDQTRNYKANNFRHLKSDSGNYFLEVHPSMDDLFGALRPERDLASCFMRVIVFYPPLIMILGIPFLIYFWGGLQSFDDPYSSLFLGLAIVFSALGCGMHEPWRFRLVQYEIDQMIATVSRSRP